MTFPSDSRLMDVRTHACGWGRWKGTVRWVRQRLRRDHDAGEVQWYVLFPGSEDDRAGTHQGALIDRGLRGAVAGRWRPGTPGTPGRTREHAVSVPPHACRRMVRAGLMQLVKRLMSRIFIADELRLRTFCGKYDSRFHATSSFALRVARRARLAHPTMGLQGKRWPKWKPRRDNSSQDLTDENRKKKLHHGVKCIRKVGWFSSPSRISSRAPLGAWRRVARTPALIANEFALTSRPSPRRHASAGSEKSSDVRGAEDQATRRAGCGGGGQGARGKRQNQESRREARAAPPSAVVDPEKLERQLSGRRADLEALGELMGNATFDAVLASRDAPSADAALPSSATPAPTNPRLRKPRKPSARKPSRPPAT